MVPWPLVICRPMPGSLLNFYTNLFETGMSGLVDEKIVLTAELPFRAFVTLNECRNRIPDPQVSINTIGFAKIARGSTSDPVTHGSVGPRRGSVSAVTHLARGSGCRTL